MSSWQIIDGDCRDVLRMLPAGSVHTCVTSPPYFGLRDYGHDGQIGLEPSPDEFVAALVAVFREVWRVLRDDGTVWLNLGDSYSSTAPGQVKDPMATSGLDGINGEKYRADRERLRGATRDTSRLPGVKVKDLLGIPWLVAFALRADSWYLRSDIIWSKPNPMPESVTDRPTKAHEYVFLLSKGPRYFYDADAIRERAEQPNGDAALTKQHKAAVLGHTASATSTLGTNQGASQRNKRSVWTVATQPYAGAHFATFPPKLIEPCILAGAPEGGRVLDPFAGAGTTGLVALRHGRDFVGIELNPEYAQMARDRIETAVRLGLRPAQNGDTVIAGQLDMFGEVA